MQGPTRSYWALGLALAGTPWVLGGCAGGSFAPTARDSMLVIGGGSGPVYAKLRGKFREVRGSGQETNPGNAKLIVVDGSGFGPSALAALPILRRALDSGVSVLCLNASEPHKKALLTAKLTALCSHGTSDAFLVTPLGGGNRFHVTNLASKQLRRRRIAHERDPNGVIIGQHHTSTQDLPVNDALVDRYIGQISDRLEVQGRSPATVPTPPTDYPSASWKQYAYTEVWNTGADGSINNQSIGHDITYTFLMYFDSGATLSTHWFQWVAVSVDGTVSPSAPTLNDEDHRGWVVTQNMIQMDPVDDTIGNGLQLAFVQSQPTNVANTLSSSMNFDIGYKGANGNTAWLWQQSLSQTTGSFSDWSATSLPPSSGDINAVTLNYMQTSPFDGDGSNWTDAFYTVFQGKHIHGINSSSANPMEIVGQALWRTQLPFSGVVSLQVDSGTLMTNLRAKNDVFTYHEYYNSDYFGSSMVLDLDLSQIQAPEAP